MNCEKCKYYTNSYFGYGVCSINNLISPKSCGIETDEHIKDLHICFNCKHWIGSGDWGLSCAKKYHVATTNGFREACENFSRK